jgi:hypothetical protein
MNVETGISFALIIIVLINISIVLFVLKKLNFSKHESEGINEGSKLPDIYVEDYKGKKTKLLPECTLNNKVMIFIDLECSECLKVFDSLKVYKEEYLKNITFILKKMEGSTDIISKSFIRDQSVFLSEEEILNVFNITGFPFSLVVDNMGIVIKRSYFSKNALVDYLT